MKKRLIGVLLVGTLVMAFSVTNVSADSGKSKGKSILDIISTKIDSIINGVDNTNQEVTATKQDVEALTQQVATLQNTIEQMQADVKAIQPKGEFSIPVMFNGKAIPGVLITFTNKADGRAYSFRTSGDGNARGLLPEGIYTATINDGTYTGTRDNIEIRKEWLQNIFIQAQAK